MMGEAKHEARALFTTALALGTPDERARYLDEACQGKPELRQRVEALLRAHDQADGFLEANSPEPDVLPEGPGTVIGRYKLLEEIGEGAFGRVFMAEQTEPVRRKVALKIIKAGMDTREVVARFGVERQALALMDHPNIAKVLDAGATETGRPFFVMELVRGVPITGYCEQQQLSTAERLQLFMKVCHAVQHAHQKGIIHRDLKPSNVLVSWQDDRAVAKVIDFGIAKATDRKSVV
jgi:eukaryotic-like serine/threonine-protein kinase